MLIREVGQERGPGGHLVTHWEYRTVLQSWVGPRILGSMHTGGQSGGETQMRTSIHAMDWGTQVE